MTHSFKDPDKLGTRPLIDKCRRCGKRRPVHHHFYCDLCYARLRMYK